MASSSNSFFCNGMDRLRNFAATAFSLAEPYLLIIAVSLVVLWLGVILTQRIEQRNLQDLLRGQIANANSSPSAAATASEKKKKSAADGRPFGVWEPSDYKTPTPPPHPNWSLEHTKPLPYRPFRYGPTYHVTMGIRPIDIEEWIELDNQYLYFHKKKAERITERGPRLCRTADSAFEAAIELLEELCEYLPARYPTLFQKTKEGINNLATNEKFNIRERPLKEDPMQIVARLVQDDVAIMIEKDDGQVYLLAGAVVIPGFWRLHDKFGMPLSDVHTSGNVPQFKEKLEAGMTNFFRRIKPENPVQRNNYFFQIDGNLPWSTSLGSEDDYDNTFQSHADGFKSNERDVKIEDLHFRTERQTLRRLPRTGGVVFTFRTYLIPITEIAEEPYVPGRLASAVRSWGEDSADYKGRAKYEHILLPYLDRKFAEQISQGLDLAQEEKDRSYPW